ncbi:MAG: replication initiator protein A [Staphylococcus simulans]|uniref:replication initiator protein A n=2 Tax=Staphylococcus TaxID=1279 RepID=UPI002553C464|nr:replication initiator protein A [Staphylococcus simulans]MDK7928221.1 replication initiator protein A [Staphylococcus simulans]MDK8316875.1 replication initiator protein A [Staphylococcus simulans]
MSNKFYLEEQYKERFYQLPKVFFTNSTYKKMSNDAKIAYAILRDRLELSIINKWVDADNAIYFIYTNETLENILNVSKPKVVKIKKELENANLLEQKKQGLNKPNMLYLMKPNVTNDDIYKLQQDENIDKASINKEVKNFNSNDTDITTTTKKESSSSNILKWLRKINLEFNIPITTAYQKELIPLLMKFDESIIYYAIQYASKHGKNPKVFLLKVLQNWSDKGIKSLSEVINYNVQTTDNITSKELTPKWLNNPEQLRNKQLTPEERIKFEKQREAFKQQLIKDWEN